MGEISEMMLEGVLCIKCGSIVEDVDMGFPQKCNDCKKYDEDKPVMKENRYEFAMQKLKQLGLNPVLMNKDNYHVKIGKWNFYPWTGKFYKDGGVKFADRVRGINKFIDQHKKDKMIKA